MLPSEYCPSLTTKGIVVIPAGHPLNRFVGDPEYGSVLSEYLGTGTGYGVCTYHQYSGGSSYQNYDPTVQNILIPDAQRLIDNAYSLMSTLDPSSAMYGNIQVAINQLQTVINNPSASTSDVASAMAVLTQAMTGY